MTNRIQAKNKATRNVLGRIRKLIEGSIEVIEQFDNKVLNVKLTKALEEKGIKASIDVEYKKPVLVYRSGTENCESYTDGFGRTSSVYSDIRSYSFQISYKEYQHGKQPRIDSEKTIENIKETLKNIDNKIETFSFSDERIKELHKQFEDIDNQVEKLLSSMSHAERDALRSVYRGYNIKI